MYHYPPMNDQFINNIIFNLIVHHEYIINQIYKMNLTKQSKTPIFIYNNYHG